MSFFALLIWATAVGIAVLVLYIRDPYATGLRRARQVDGPPLSAPQANRPTPRWMSMVSKLGVCRRAL